VDVAGLWPQQARKKGFVHNRRLGFAHNILYAIHLSRYDMVDSGGTMLQYCTIL